MTRIALASLLALVFLSPVQAQQPRCAPHAEMVKLLTGKFKEERRGIGLVNNNRVVEFYVSDKGSWTIIGTKPNGVACIIAAGKEWNEIEAAPKGEPA